MQAVMWYAMLRALLSTTASVSLRLNYLTPVSWPLRFASPLRLWSAWAVVVMNALVGSGLLFASALLLRLIRVAVPRILKEEEERSVRYRKIITNAVALEIRWDVVRKITSASAFFNGMMDGSEYVE